MAPSLPPDHHKLLPVIVPLSIDPTPVLDLKQYDKRHPGLAEREINNKAYDFAHWGRNAFLHYAGPLLERRRQLLLQSGLSRKNFPKPASQLWEGIVVMNSSGMKRRPK